jgi:hypothetical protein
VLKVPSRKYPGVLIQGDSLSGILGELQEAIDLFEREESLGCLKLAFNNLKRRLDGYQRVCVENKVGLPF